jgi:hypothetical protein
MVTGQSLLLEVGWMFLHSGEVCFYACEEDWLWWPPWWMMTIFFVIFRVRLELNLQFHILNFYRFTRFLKINWTGLTSVKKIPLIFYLLLLLSLKRCNCTLYIPWSTHTFGCGTPIPNVSAMANHTNTVNNTRCSFVPCYKFIIGANNNKNKVKGIYSQKSAPKS